MLGLDQDDDALAAAATALASFGSRVRLRKARFDHLSEVMREEGIDFTSAVLLDLGVSSPQFDRPERGFSYRNDGPLDMRMDQTQSLNMATVVNEYDVRQLADVLRTYGDERYATNSQPPSSLLVPCRPRPSWPTSFAMQSLRRTARGGHPARRTFQALRIEVNDELGILTSTVEQAVEGWLRWAGAPFWRITRARTAS